jgi:hypothetical protein
MQTGLLIRPSGAVHTGSMFGDGIYLLIRLRNLLVIHLKWFTLDQGNENRAFLALFEHENVIKT